MTIKRRIDALQRRLGMWSWPRPASSERSNVFIVPTMDTPIPMQDTAGLECLIVIPDNGRSRRDPIGVDRSD